MSAPTLPIEIHHSRGVAIFMLVCALFILGTTLLVGVSLNTVTGVILLLVSIGYLVNPALVVTESGIEHRNILGMTLRRTDYAAFRDLSVDDDGTFYVMQNGSKEKVRGVLRFFLNGADVKRLEEAVRAAR